MVAIVSGMRSGLELGSLEVLGLRENVGGTLRGSNGQGVYVNVSQGQVVVQDQDDLLVARGHDAALLRTYNSNGSINDDNGDGWTSGVSQLRVTGTVGAVGSTIQRIGADGAAAIYAYDSFANRYFTTEGSGAYDTIAYVAADAQFEWCDGSTGALQRYEGSGAMRLLSSRDTSGNALTCNYGANGFLSSVTTANGDTVWYDYAGNNLSQVRTTAGGVTTTRARYAYDAFNRLASVTLDLSPADNSIADGKVYQTSYTYDGASKRIASVTQSDGTSVAFTYQDVGAGVYKLATVRDGLGQATSFTYGTGFTTVTDPLGFVTRYDHDGQGQITGITGPAVAGTGANRRFVYDTSGNVTSVTDGEGRVTTYEYDRGNQTRQRDAAGNTVDRTFDARNQLVSETTYTQPDADGAGPGLPGGALVSRRVYDATGRNQLRFAISAEGRVTEYRYDGPGQQVSQITYAGSTYPYLGVAPDASFTENALASWAAGQDRSRTQRVDLAYDVRGQLQSRTTFARVGATGDGIFDGTQAVERYVYDAAGRLLQTVSPTGGVTSYTHDGLGRMLTATDALGQVTITQHDDAGRKLRVSLAGGLVTTTTMDAAGRVTAVAQSNTSGAALGETRFFYDADDRLRMTQDPTGVRSWVLYDPAGRKTAEIDGNGTMTEYTYDRRDLVTGITTWGTAVNTAMLVDAAGLPLLSATAAGVRPPASGGDAGIWRQYDDAGRLVREAKSVGTSSNAQVTEMRYDGASRLVQTVRYANTIVATIGTANGVVMLPAPSPQDRVTRHFHDADGLLAGTLDAEGYLTTFRYTAAGQLLERVAYATATPSGARAAGTLAQLVPAWSPADVREQTAYNARGQAWMQVDGEGFVTETVYDASGNATQVIRYATAVAVGMPGSTTQPSRPAPSPSDRSTLRSFDALNRVVRETSPEGVVTQFSYDAAGNLVSTVRAAGTGEVRTILARYDVQGRLTGELTAEGAALLTGGQTQAQVDAIWAQYGTSHAYDAASRRIATTDALGNRTLFFYDADGALTHKVNALGEVQESRYDARGRLAAILSYAGRIATTGLTGGLASNAFTTALASIANAALDSRTTLTYTRDGRVASTTDALGTVSTSTYDAFGDEASRQLSGAAVNLLETYTVDRRGQRTGTLQSVGGTQLSTSTVYDAFGRTIRSTDANGNVREQAYDRLGRVVSWKDPAGGRRSATYDAFDRVLTQTDALGSVTRYAYDAAARSLRVTTAEGIVTTTFYTRHGQVERVVDANNQSTSYLYDRNGNLLRTTLPVGTTSSAYDAAGRVTETIDANGTRVAYAYDAAHRVLTRRVDPAGLNLTTTYQYDAKGQRVSVTDAMGVTSTVEYDRLGRVLKQTVDPAGLNLQTVSTYDARGNVLTVRSPGGTLTQYVYDALGRRTQERVDPAGLNLQRSWAYDRNGNVVSSTDPRGYVTRYAYDVNDRLVFTVDALGNVQQLAYDAAGRVVKTVTYAKPAAIGTLPPAPTAAQVGALVTPQPALDAVEHRVYDKDSRLVATVDGTGGVVRYVYDGNGNVVSRTAFASPLAIQAWTPGTLPVPGADSARDATLRTVYDGMNRAIYTIDGTGAVVANSYDNNGNLLRRTAYAAAVPAGTAATTSALSTAVALVANASRDATVSHTYDAAGRLTWTVDAVRAVTQRVYDRNGNVVRRVEYATALPQGGAASSVAASAGDRSTTMAYDAANRLVFEVDALRGVTEQAYDADGHVTRRTTYAAPIASVPTPGQSGTADAIRSLLAANAGADRSTRFGWDAAGRQVLVVDALGAVTETQYDGTGNVVATIAYAKTVDAAVLGANPTLAAMKLLVRATPSADRTSRTAYDAGGRAVYTVDALGAVRGSQYDGVGRLVRTVRYAVAVNPGTTGVDAIATALRPDPSRDPGEFFTYDAAGRLITAVDAHWNTESFAYDALGNKLTFTNKKGASWTYAYDAAGRLITETSPEVPFSPVPLPDGALVASAAENKRIVTRLAYDALGNLVQRTEASGLSGERTTRYEYDALGRQVRVIHPPVGIYDLAADALTTNGATYLAGRVERNVQLTSETFYDTLGNAVANRDVGNAVSQKVYDVLGRLVYEVDALGYVTGYTHDAFGDVTQLVRYGTQTALTGAGLTQSAQAASRAQVNTALAAAGFDHSRDRVLVSTYDRLGQLVEKTEPSAFFYDSSADAASQTGTAGRKTQNTYDAFGQLVKSRVLRNQKTDTWATTTRYYDRLGHEVAMVDAMGYLTERAFDTMGNLTSFTEYANAVAGAWTVDGYTKSATSPDDRTTVYTYDGLNRKTSERRVQVEISMRPDGTPDRATPVTSFGYDAVGNQTWVSDPLGKVTYTYYDALGRVVAIAAPPRSSTASGVSLTPLTTFLRDAYGNAVAVVEHARGTASATGERWEPPIADGADRWTISTFDSFGRATQVQDAAGSSTYFSYDAYGHVAKQWQGATGDDTVTRTAFQVHEYDPLGRLVKTHTPASTSVWQAGVGVTTVSQAQAGLVTAAIEYNAFGEITRKGTQGGWQEYFDYDNAGRLWRTNTGDGVDRIQLYDLQGNVTSEIRSGGKGGGDVDLRTFANAEAAANHPYTRRVDMQVDMLGRVTSKAEAVRQETQGGLSVQHQYTTATVLQRADGPYSQNLIALTWNSLAALGSGDIRITLEYTTPVYMLADHTTGGGTWRTFTTGVMEGDRWNAGGQLGWNNGLADWGVDKIYRIAVEKKDKYGNWQLILDQPPGHGRNSITVQVSPDPNAIVELYLHPASNTANPDYYYAGLVNFGMGARMDASGLAPGDYDYAIITWDPLRTDNRITTMGRFTVSLPPLNSITGLRYFQQNVPPGFITWPNPPPATTQVFRYRPNGSTGAWSTLEVTPPRTFDPLREVTSAVDTSALRGSYQYELLWTYAGQNAPGAHATGYFEYWGPTQAGVSVTTSPGSPAISTNEGIVIGGQTVSMDAGARSLRPVVSQKVDRWGNVVEITDPRNAAWKTTYRYNANNQVVQQVLPDAGQGAATTTIYYDAHWRQMAVRDANGRINWQFYDEGGNLEKEIQADWGEVRHQYNAFGDKVRTIDAMGKAVGYAYDKMSRVVSIDKGVASVWRADWTAATVVGTRMLTEVMRYDQLGRKLSQTNGNGETTLYAYDAAGNLIATTQPRGQVTRAAYDARGNKTSEHDANGSVASWSYNYFGQVLKHWDLGGREFTYSYDNARQLVWQGSPGGQSISYDYDAAGQVVNIRDWANGKTTTYVYDLSGRRLRERVDQGGITYQDNSLAYDTRGNLRVATDGHAVALMEYDQVGNRTRVWTHVGYDGVNGERAVSTDRYFRYDEMNRQIVVDAVDAAGNIGRQGHRVTYDKNGNRTSDTFWGQRIIAADGSSVGNFDQYGTGYYTNLFATYLSREDEVQETYRYDALNRLESVIRDGVQIDIRRYDAADRVVQSGPGTSLPVRYAELINQGLSPEQMNGKETRINHYDTNGWLVHQTVFKSDNTRKLDIGWGWTLSYYGQSWAGSRDAVGNANAYVVVNHEGGYMNKFTTTRFAKYDKYEAEVTTAQSTKLLPGSSTQRYDANGFLVGVEDATQPANNRWFVNDATGKALYANQGWRIQRQFIVDGEVLGLYGQGVDPMTPATGYNNVPNFRNVEDFDFGYSPIGANYPAPSPGAYIVRSGDTLQGIAQGAYGDSALWFRIAEANGLASSNDLRVGQALTIPNRVSTIHNNATTFKPYDPSRIEGDKTPSMAMPQPKKKSSWLKKLLMAVVAVAVAYLTGQWYLTNFGSGVSVVAATGEMTTVWTTTSLGAAGALGGAVGSIAGQAVGIATGELDRFDWKGVGLSAIGGGIAMGLGGVNGTGGVSSGPLTNPAIRAVVTSAATQAIGVATGLQDHFSWKSVAASGVGAFVGAGVAPEAGESFGGRLITALAAGAAAAVAKGGKVTVQQVAVDAFGNALGASLATASSEAPTTPSAVGSDDSLGDFITKNNNWAHVDVGPIPALVSGRTFSESIAERKAANNPHELPTFSREAHADAPSSEQLQAIQSYSGVPAAEAQRLLDSGYRVTTEGLRNMQALDNPEGRPTGFLPAIFGTGSAAGSGGIVGGGYQAVRPQGTGAPPPFIDPRTDMPTGAPGFAPADPSLTWGVSGKPIFELPSIDWTKLPPLLQAPKVLSDFLTYMVAGGSDRKTFEVTAPVEITGKSPREWARSYEAGVRGLYGQTEEQRYKVILDGKVRDGRADATTVIGGKEAAVEAKFVSDWERSPRNPANTRPWMDPQEQAAMFNQARRYSAAYEGGAIYHTNSVELAKHWSKVFADAGLNTRFLITPAQRK
ncbi:LysM peptidoglycan-binding domain-containing protein [Ramlibacter sp. USB13]|uniref:LysM peptidoglycan-binding domain-containing protein n=1 Tax=Ramlibacter cellulosilyticus TaxID=2764187 RepID=A0A923MS84_9BURK|nr:LysM peptidoglycan-binding domain-containing protein [Ramlibacter cellulosilyticus]MBC5784230.1 LysM peptidoglycan-binding domain-containing protein [Ramlibacter cellulosilyticus]